MQKQSWPRKLTGRAAGRSAFESGRAVGLRVLSMIKAVCPLNRADRLEIQKLFQKPKYSLALL